MKYVRVTMEGYSARNKHFWVATILNDVVNLKKGFRKDIFRDNKPIDYYNTDSDCAAAMRNIESITLEEYEKY